MGYCVYIHTNKKNGKVYIGITSQTLLQRSGKGGKNYIESRRFWNAIKTYGWNGFDHDIIIADLSRKTAELFEIAFISIYNATDSRYGYNLESGGNIQKRHSQDTRAKMSESHKSEYMTPEQHLKRSEAVMGGKHPRARTVLCVTTQKRYSCAMDAERDTGVSHSHIAACCRGRYGRKTSGKAEDGTPLVWKYGEEVS